MITLAIFDFNNTLVNSDEVCYIAEKELLKRYGKDLPKEIYDKYHNWLFLPDKKVMEYYIQDFAINSSITKLLKEKADSLTDVMQRCTRPMPGAKELLTFLNEKNITCAIASNTNLTAITQGLAVTGLTRYFNTIQCKDDVLHQKPFPDVYTHVLSCLEIKASNAIAFDDAYEGVKAAQQAGIFCFAVPLLVADYNRYDDCGLIIQNLLHAQRLLSRMF